ncbi:MAG TPA: glycerophosphodiester phosphodiesterase family protein [Candidatus Paceibacterota bacterium]|nr:glycerophosphodiester phosphodiesterase family protein [Candidatus Paceibacterota bacterium]
MSETIVVYHRCGGKSLNYPPNTILTAQWAQAHGARAIEYDVVLAQDGDEPKMVVMEPKVIKEAGLDINNLRWEDVRNLDAGNATFGFQKIPTLEEMLTAIDASKTGHQIQLKGQHPDSVKVLLSKVTNLNSFVITAFDISVIQEIKSFDKTIPVGWLVKPQQEGGDEAGVDLTAKLVADIGSIRPYSEEEIESIVKTAKENTIEVILLCGPRINSREMVQKFRSGGSQVGAWGVATNLALAKQLIEFGLDRFTLDNPEELALV